jgi:hypothetical protein
VCQDAGQSQVLREGDCVHLLVGKDKEGKWDSPFQLTVVGN